MLRLFDPSTVATRRSLSRVAHFNDALPDDLVEQLWTNPTSLVAMGQTLQARGVRRTVSLTWSSQRYVLKHYVEPSLWHTLKRKVQSSRASITWNVMHKLADAGIATPRPVAYVENRWGMLQRDSFLLYPYIDGRTLQSCFAADAKQSYSTTENLWRQLGELWQRLAQVQASLDDTNVGNFIVSPAKQLWVIDLDKARFHRLAFAAARKQKIAWEKLLHSAARCYSDNRPRRVAA